MVGFFKGSTIFCVGKIRMRCKKYIFSHTYLLLAKNIIYKDKKTFKHRENRIDDKNLQDKRIKILFI